MFSCRTQICVDQPAERKSGAGTGESVGPISLNIYILGLSAKCVSLLAVGTVEAKV